jgi:hypothetical protein
LTVVKRYLPNLVSAFTSPVYPKDILSKTKDPDDPDFFWRGKEVFIVFSDPLKVRTLETDAGLFMSDESLPFHRLMAYRCLSICHLNDVSDLQNKLDEIKVRFSNSLEFFKAYKEYIRM